MLGLMLLKEKEIPIPSPFPFTSGTATVARVVNTCPITSKDLGGGAF